MIVNKHQFPKCSIDEFIYENDKWTIEMING